MSAGATPATLRLLLAHAIHQLGPRKEQPFVAVDCGALQENLLESELFGHKKGAFTGAIRDKIGLFEVANGGSVFLDEISTASPSVQARLLRFLQEGEIRRVGENKPLKIDVRVLWSSPWAGRPASGSIARVPPCWAPA